MNEEATLVLEAFSPVSSAEEDDFYLRQIHMSQGEKTIKFGAGWWKKFSDAKEQVVEAK